MVLALTSVGLILGLLALRWSSAVPWTRRARLGYCGAIAALAGLTVAEGIAVTVTLSPSGASPPAFGVVYAGYIILLAAALLMVGFEVARAPWRDWSRWLPFTLAAWLLAVVVPALATSFTAALCAISAWLLLFAVLVDGPWQHGSPIGSRRAWSLERVGNPERRADGLRPVGFSDGGERFHIQSAR